MYQIEICIRQSEKPRIKDEGYFHTICLAIIMLLMKRMHKKPQIILRKMFYVHFSCSYACLQYLHLECIILLTLLPDCIKNTVSRLTTRYIKTTYSITISWKSDWIVGRFFISARKSHLTPPTVTIRWLSCFEWRNVIPPLLMKLSILWK